MDRLDNKELLNVMVAYDPYVSTRALANRLEEQLNVVVSKDTVCSRMRKHFRYSKEMPDELTEKHKADRARWCQMLLD